MEALIGINEICKTRWAGQWPSSATAVVQQTQTSRPPSSCEDDLNVSSTDEEDAKPSSQLTSSNIMTIDYQQLQQQFQQQLSMEQLQIISHLQVATTVFVGGSFY
jgi:hypothetical protein